MLQKNRFILDNDKYVINVDSSFVKQDCFANNSQKKKRDIKIEDDK